MIQLRLIPDNHDIAATGNPTTPRSPEERRARRLERREKQRQANAGRALKMRAARLAPELAAVPQQRTPPAVNVGCSGWFYWHWRRSFYPSELPTKDWFVHYARH